jgi:lipid-A-disaccharide synthase-like uncharacterized protein
MTDKLWLAVGFLAQAIFSARFIVQWIASERARKSIVPVAFWFISVAGGSLLLAYAVHIRDPVFIVGQAAGVLIYTRNLFLIHGEKKHSGGADAL